MTALQCAFSDFRSFRDFIRARPETLDRDRVSAMVDSIRRQELIETRRFGPCPVSIDGDNYREDLRVLGMPGRCFAMLDLLDEATGMDASARVLCLEGLTRFSRVIRSLYPQSICSEYAPEEHEQRRIAPIPHVDAMDMPFPAARFDAVISGDVFEHVPDLPKVLSECRRVLGKGGALISTFPFAAGDKQTHQKAVLEDGVVRHLVPVPEYHGDPVRPGEGVLVFQIPAWDIIGQCMDAGFASAEMVYVSDAHRGILGTDMDGQFVLRAIA